MTDYSKAISYLRPKAIFHMRAADDLSTLVWLDESQERPSDEAIIHKAVDLAGTDDVPERITPYQARMALLDAGLLDGVEAMMSSPTTAAAARIAWEYATVWERNSAFIAALAPALGLSETEIDDLFIAAAAI